MTGLLFWCRAAARVRQRSLQPVATPLRRTAPFLTNEINHFASPLHIAQRAVLGECLPRIEHRGFAFLGQFLSLRRCGVLLRQREAGDRGVRGLVQLIDASSIGVSFSLT